MEKGIYMFNTPKGNRLHIAIFGKRNAGKSSLINAFLGQELSIVSKTPGTTTDPVEKAYELQPFGPVLFIDTAGIDDKGELGKKRITKTNDVLKRTDLAILLIENNPDNYELELIKIFTQKNITWIPVINKADLLNEKQIKNLINRIKDISGHDATTISVKQKKGIEKLKDIIIKKLDTFSTPPSLINDLVKPKDTVVLVIPIDKEAPQGRIILPQVQTIREALDSDVISIVLKDIELDYALKHILKKQPKLIITDSQAFEQVNAIVPDNILLTSFSTLFARQKGDLKTYIKGLDIIKKLKNGDKILIAELCSHRPIAEDIGRIKIPAWLKKHTGVDLQFEAIANKDYPKDLTRYKLVIQCGGCTVNRKYIISRIEQAKEQGVAITNYGIIIAYINGILERALTPFDLTEHPFQKI